MKCSEMLNSGKYTTTNCQTDGDILCIFLRDDNTGLEGTMKVRVEGKRWVEILEDNEVK